MWKMLFARENTEFCAHKWFAYTKLYLKFLVFKNLLLKADGLRAVITRQENNLMTVFLFPRVVLTLAFKSYLLVFTAFPRISPGDSRTSRVGREGAASWHPASFPIDSWALITGSCNQQWCANQDLTWICKSQVELTAKTFKKQNWLSVICPSLRG